MNEKKAKTFREIPLFDDNRQTIVNALKEEGFSEEQLNAMDSGRVWKLYLDTVGETLSRQISEITRATEKNPQLASKINPLIKKSIQQLENLADSLEKELDKKKGKGISHE